MVQVAVGSSQGSVTPRTQSLQISRHIQVIAIVNILEHNSQISEGKWNIKELVAELFSEIFHKSEGSCAALISDRANQDIFSSKIFGNLKLSYLKVLVDEKEDLLSPNYITLRVVEKIYSSNCSIYIILLSNGNQMSRFLKFSERYRMLNTRANFILLHDHQLFDSKLHHIWKKIVNVIFVSFNEESNQYDNGKYKWYELTSLPFPFSSRQSLVPFRVNTWSRGLFRYATQLFPEKTSNLRGQKLRIALFEHLPGSIKTSPTKFQNVETIEGNNLIGYEGLEIEVLQTIAKSMNFEFDIYETVNVVNDNLPNGSLSNVLGALANNDADIVLGNLYYTSHHLDYLDLTVPYASLCLTFITPESTTDNSWKTLILPFKSYMWICTFVTLMLAVLAFYALEIIHMKIACKKHLKSELFFNRKIVMNYENIKNHLVGFPSRERFLFGKLDKALLYAYSMLLLVSLPRLPEAGPLRMITGWWYLYCLLIVVAYRASMTAILTKPPLRITIDTLYQLASSPVQCGGWDLQSKYFFLRSLDRAGQVIGRKFEVINDANEAIERTSRGQFAYYDNVYFLTEAIRKKMQLHNTQNQVEEDHLNTTTYENNELRSGRTNLHIMQQCVINMPVALGLQKNSPLKSKIDDILLSIVEAGLVKKWLHDVLRTNEQPEDNFPAKAFMDLPKIHGILIAITVGYAIGIGTLIAEKIHWMYFVINNPLFDIYKKNEF
ncbi:ionotropic receptor 21a-like [Bacillus rossius redtenbacheri]|uniref:ionotropic receptor 21a-like n=1 Tax=Bacillus rossius redtenbacheri TaxID=93214 RepID=UPI002FDDD237